MGQANAARNKLYDLRECDLKGQSGAGKDMSGAIFSEADFSGINFKEGTRLRSYATTDLIRHHPAVIFIYSPTFESVRKE